MRRGVGPELVENMSSSSWRPPPLVQHTPPHDVPLHNRIDAAAREALHGDAEAQSLDNK